MDYDASVMGLGPNGWVEGHVDDIAIHCDFIMDFWDYHIFMQDFRVTNVRGLSLKVKGNILIDWMINIVMSIVTTLFKGTVVEYIADKVYLIMQDTIDTMNRAIKDFIYGDMVNKAVVEKIKTEFLNGYNTQFLDFMRNAIFNKTQNNIN